MSKDTLSLSRRERQIIEIIYRFGRATAIDIHSAMDDAPSYSAVRGLLHVMQEKGLVTHRRLGRRNLYAPTLPARQAGRSALLNLVRTFFDDSPEKAVTTLLDISGDELSPEALDRLSRLIERAREEDAHER